MIQYAQIVPGVFLDRPNRFLAQVKIGEETVLCHVKNTGRCRELLIPGAQVWCQRYDDPKRKTKYSLITVCKQGRLVNLDSQVPNAAAAQWIQSGGLGQVPENLRREYTYGDSRYDLYFVLNGQPCLMEVKGVTLELNNVARFPDAPTARGRKHLRGLAEAAQAGWGTYVLFVVQMDGVSLFQPNWQTDPEFAEALCHAAESGVQVLAAGCYVSPEELEITHRLPVALADWRTGEKGHAAVDKPLEV